MKSFPPDVRHRLERLLLDFLEWIEIPVRRSFATSRLQAKRTTLYEAHRRLMNKGYVTRTEKKHGGIGRPHTMWALSEGWKIQQALKTERE